MFTAWILSFYIECGVLCYSKGEYEYDSKSECLEQSEILYKRGREQGHSILRSICSPKTEVGKDSKNN